MARSRQSVASRTRRKATLRKAKGYYGNKSRSFKAAHEQVMHSGQYAFRDRRARKGEFRRLWIQRINAAARRNGTTYSRLIWGLDLAGVTVDRKNLADLAVHDPAAFTALAERAKAALGDPPGDVEPATADDEQADASGDAAADADADAGAPADSVDGDAAADAPSDAAVAADAPGDAVAADAPGDAAVAADSADGAAPDTVPDTAAGERGEVGSAA